jgi:hypothetical protein
MKPIIIIYGFISAIMITILLVATTLLLSKIGYETGEIAGYSAIILSFLVIFFAVSEYRKKKPERGASFKDAFLIGLSITFIASLFYAVTWVVLYYTVIPDFWDQYGNHVLGKMRSNGATEQAIRDQLETLTKYKEMYKNPVINLGFAFIEPFPVGVVISIIAALIARFRK